jgi:hypothetical protein
VRKEDKVRLPPKVRLNLPPGYYVLRDPRGYLLYDTATITMAGRPGVMHTLVGGYEKGRDPRDIEAGAWEHHSQTTKDGSDS